MGWFLIAVIPLTMVLGYTYDHAMTLYVADTVVEKGIERSVRAAAWEIEPGPLRNGVAEIDAEKAKTRFYHVLSANLRLDLTLAPTPNSPLAAQPAVGFAVCQPGTDCTPQCEPGPPCPAEFNRIVLRNVQNPTVIAAVGGAVRPFFAGSERRFVRWASVQLERAQ